MYGRREPDSHMLLGRKKLSSVFCKDPDGNQNTA
jgi:hypothetical protein